MSDLSAALRMHTRIDAWHRIAMQPALAELVFFPSRYLHSSWRAKIFPEGVGEAVWSCDAAHDHLSSHINEALALSDFVVTPDLDHVAWTIALMPGDRLFRLMMHLGVVVVSTEIRNAVSRPDIQTIVDQIGRELYNFSLQRAGLIYAQPPTPASLPLAQRFSDIGLRVRRIGRDLLGRFMNGCDPALWERVQLKFDYDAQDEAVQGTSTVTDTVMRRIVPRIMREIN